MSVKATITHNNPEKPITVGSVWRHPEDHGTVYVLIGQQSQYATINAKTFSEYWMSSCKTTADAVSGLVRLDSSVLVEFS
jgi:hypothetical protein